jgi:metal-dependent amidase/aminoacylase/carboxypeptidase family protein
MLCFYFNQQKGGGGAKKMIEDGVLNEMEFAAAFGLHMYPNANTSHILTRVGPFMAASDRFKAVIIGTVSEESLHFLKNLFIF